MTDPTPDEQIFTYNDGQFKAVKLHSPITHQLLGYQIASIDSKRRLLKMYSNHNTIIVSKDGTWKRDEGFFPTPNEAISTFLSQVNGQKKQIIIYE